MTETLETRVALIEEKVRAVGKHFDDLDKFFTIIRDTTDLEQRIAILEKEVELIEVKMKTKVEKNEFWPVKSIVYGLVGLILAAVCGTLLYTIGLKLK